jgi:hypothetical protein
MTAKYVFYLMIILIIAGLLFSTYYFWKKSNPIIIEENTQTYYTTKPIETRIIRESLPTKIDTVYIDGSQNEIAYYETSIDSNNVNVDLSISYDERMNVFSLDHNITTMMDSIYVEKEVVKTITKSPQLIRLTGGILTIFESQDETKLKNVGIDAGIKIVDKYSITGYINTNKEFGIRLGIDF